MDDKETTANNASTLRDCFSAELLKRITSSTPKTTKRTSARSRKKLSSDTAPPSIQDIPSNQQDAAELSEFIDYLSEELFEALPPELKHLSYAAIQADTTLEDTISSSSYIEDLLPNLPPQVTDSLTTYALLPASTSAGNLLLATLAAYIASATSPPPAIWSSTRCSSCEICQRDWIPLTYHHLIPKSTHEKVRKRGWHADYMLDSVAWLCRACHSFVHGIEGNEGLAREWFTVELLMEREDVRRWAAWVGRVRWKAR